jgi:hypothetical protein
MPEHVETSSSTTIGPCRAARLDVPDRRRRRLRRRHRGLGGVLPRSSMASSSDRFAPDRVAPERSQEGRLSDSRRRTD